VLDRPVAEELAVGELAVEEELSEEELAVGGRKQAVRHRSHQSR
jgi:hypothetical protein